MSLDRRQSHRFPSPLDRSEALLKVGDDSIRARLLNESANGFALHVERHPGVYEGEVVWLLANGCWTKVRISRVQASETGVELALDRLSEAPAPLEPVKRPPRFWRMPKNNRVPIIIALAALLTVSLVLLLRDWQDADPAKMEEPVPAGTSADLHRWLRDIGPAVYLAPEVVSVLRPSPRQIEQIRAITARNQQAVELCKETGASLDQIRRLRMDAQHQALEVLSATQQAKWEELVRLLERQQENAP